MSRLFSQTFSCSHCGAPQEMGIVASINADRRPDLREAVLADRYQRGECSACGKGYRVEPDLTYLDVGRGQWILVRPASHLAEWAPTEALAAAAFDRAHGAGAPDEAQAPGLQPRLAFGWPAFREKLLCAAHGLDDVALELAKLAVMRSVRELPLDDALDLRLSAVTADTLTLTWTMAGGDLAVEQLTLPRALLEGLAHDAAWAPARAELAAGAYVDLNRLLVPADEAA